MAATITGNSNQTLVSEGAAPIPGQLCVVACLGSSSTAGKGQAFNWIEALQNRLGQERFVLHNFGVGGDLAFNALQRIPQVIGSNPQKVVVLIGANDVLALVSAKVRRFYRLAKKLPRDPSPEWFRANLQVIAQRLKQTTSALSSDSIPIAASEKDAMDISVSEIDLRNCTKSRRIVRKNLVGWAGEQALSSL
jgi:hypothetical protein